MCHDPNLHECAPRETNRDANIHRYSTASVLCHLHYAQQSFCLLCGTKHGTNRATTHLFLPLELDPSYICACTTCPVERGKISDREHRKNTALQHCTLGLAEQKKRGKRQKCTRRFPLLAMQQHAARALEKCHPCINTSCCIVSLLNS